MFDAPAHAAPDLVFNGPATPLADADIVAAATGLGCEPAVIGAVTLVETGGLGGFLADGTRRPRVRYEAHVFGDATGHRWDGAHPDISTTWPETGRSLPGGEEYGRLARAMRLDRNAALGATSWGLFQILGRNHAACGYGDVAAFVAAMGRSEADHLAAFVGFVRSDGLAPLLRARNWTAFAERYNGPANQGYGARLAAAYARALRRPSHATHPSEPRG